MSYILGYLVAGVIYAGIAITVLKGRLKPSEVTLTVLLWPLVTYHLVRILTDARR